MFHIPKRDPRTKEEQLNDFIYLYIKLDAKAERVEQATVVGPIDASVVQELEMASPSSKSSDLALMIPLISCNLLKKTWPTVSQT